MLPSGSDALLRVGSLVKLGERGRRVDGAEEDGLVLVHAEIK